MSKKDVIPRQEEDEEVSYPQGVEVARLARAQRMTRGFFQTKLLDTGFMARFIMAIDQGLTVFVELPPIVAPEGGQIRTVKVRALSSNNGVVDDVELTLVNYSDGLGSFDRAVAWAETYWLSLVDIRLLFLLKWKDFYEIEERGEEIRVVATDSMQYQDARRQYAASLRVGPVAGSRRVADLWSTSAYGNARDWFAFGPVHPYISPPHER